MAEVEGAEAVGFVFRIAALALSVAAAVVMGTASQLVVVDGGRGPSSYVVSYSHYSALVYFVVAGVVSAICSAVALYLSAVHSKPAGAGALATFLDAVAQGFLFSAVGAAFAARGVVGHAAAGPWGSGPGGSSSACDIAGAFCGRVTTAAAVGASAAVAVAVAALAAKDARRSWGGCCGSC